jgi:hypothetical protein
MTEYICPHCKNPVYDDDALRCLYCGESLRRKIGFMGGIKYITPKAILVIFVAIVLLSFIILISR